MTTKGFWWKSDDQVAKDVTKGKVNVMAVPTDGQQVGDDESLKCMMAKMNGRLDDMEQTMKSMKSGYTGTKPSSSSDGNKKITILYLQVNIVVEAEVVMAIGILVTEGTAHHMDTEVITRHMVTEIAAPHMLFNKDHGTATAIQGHGMTTIHDHGTDQTHIIIMDSTVILQQIAGRIETQPLGTNLLQMNNNDRKLFVIGVVNPDTSPLDVVLIWILFL